MVYNGVRILGLGGCRWYHPGPYQYTERQMRRRIRKLRRALKKSGGVDIVIAHAPPKGLGDAEDPAHRGFACFRSLMDEYKPRFFIHGHVHRSYGKDIPKICRLGETTVVNAWEYCVIDTEEPEEKSGSRP